MSNENENLYPNLNLQNKVILSEEETRKFIDSNLNESRIKHMFKERDALVKDLKQYTKILKRWKKIDFGFKVTSVGIIATTALAAGLTGTLAAPFLVPVYLPAASAVLGSLSAIESVIFSGIIMGLTSRKKKKFSNKCKIIQSYLDKIFYYVEQCRQDSIISKDELEGFGKLMSEYRTEIEKINKFHDGQSRILSDNQMKKLKEEANKEVQKLFKEDLKKEIIQSKYSAASSTLQRMNE